VRKSGGTVLKSGGTMRKTGGTNTKGPYKTRAFYLFAATILNTKARNALALANARAWYKMHT
jgi:hypothetical protein